MERKINVRVLLVSDDIQTVHSLSRSMEKGAMQVELCSKVHCATARLQDSKFEAVVMDFSEAEAALELLKKCRQGEAHKAAIVIAILGDSSEMPDVFRAGASFVLVRPLSAVEIQRTLRASYPLMVRERQRYFRCALQIPVYISKGSRSELMATSANISEGGMAINDAPELQGGDGIALRLTLPGTREASKIEAKVCWRDDSGRAGIKFIRVSPVVQERLAVWLADRLADSLSEEIVAQG